MSTCAKIHYNNVAYNVAYIWFDVNNVILGFTLSYVKYTAVNKIF